MTLGFFSSTQVKGDLAAFCASQGYTSVGVYKTKRSKTAESYSPAASALCTPTPKAKCTLVSVVECVPVAQQRCKADARGNIGNQNTGGRKNIGHGNAGTGNQGNCNTGKSVVGNNL